MRLYSYLYKNRLGIYYLRIQKNGVDKRISLRTRDPDVARLHSYKFGAKIAAMKKNNGISEWGYKIESGNFEAFDLQSAQDMIGAREALQHAVELQLIKMAKNRDVEIIAENATLASQVKLSVDKSLFLLIAYLRTLSF
jgi:hypothetical protein